MAYAAYLRVYEPVSAFQRTRSFPVDGLRGFPRPAAAAGLARGGARRGGAPGHHHTAGRGAGTPERARLYPACGWPYLRVPVADQAALPAGLRPNAVRGLRPGNGRRRPGGVVPPGTSTIPGGLRRGGRPVLAGQLLPNPARCDDKYCPDSLCNGDRGSNWAFRYRNFASGGRRVTVGDGNMVPVGPNLDIPDSLPMEHQALQERRIATLVQEERPRTCPHVHQRPSHC